MLLAPKCVGSISDRVPDFFPPSAHTFVAADALGRTHGCARNLSPLRLLGRPGELERRKKFSLA